MSNEMTEEKWCDWCVNPLKYQRDHPVCYRHVKEYIAQLKHERKRAEGLVEILEIPGHDAACNEGEFCYPRCPRRIAKAALAKYRGEK